MMNSIVQEVLSRSGVNSSPEGPMNNSDNAELLEILKTRIVIFGRGGRGRNTIERLYEEGFEGAELYAANMYAQHLIPPHAVHKNLFGNHKRPRCSAPQIGK